MLGLSFGHKAKFVRRFAHLGSLGGNAVEAFCIAVREGTFPTLAESYKSSGKTGKLKVYGGGHPLPIAEAR